MPQIKYLIGQAWEDTGPILLSRVVNNAGNYIQQSEVSSIAYYVYDVNSPSTPVDSGAIVVASSIFNALQTDNLWDVDDTGYNFKWAMNKTQIAAPGTYRVEIKFTPVSGEQFFLVYILEVLEILSA